MRDHIAGGALTETTFLVLLSTYTPTHGYGMMQFIENETNGRVILGAGTLYGAINTLLKKKWIEPVGGEVSVNRKEYRITALGKGIAERERARIGRMWELSTKIMGGDEA